MRMNPREFPLNRRRDPKRRAEREVYEALAGSDRQGFVYYEWRRDYQHPELDFALWIAGLGRIALQVKGGHYLFIDGEWHLKTRQGKKVVRSSPLDETWLAMLDLHGDIEEKAQTSYNPFIIPVLALTDMEPNPAIENLARRKGVYLAWRTDALMDDLTEIIRGRGISDSLPMDRVAREVYAITDGQIRLNEFGQNRARNAGTGAISGSVPKDGAKLWLKIVKGAGKAGHCGRVKPYHWDEASRL